MCPREIRYDASLDSVWEELVYTEARLLKDKRASDLAPQFTTLVDRCESTQAGQRKAWRAEVIAQAAVDWADDTLDDVVDDIDVEIVHTDRRSSSGARHARYFGSDTPYGVIRLGLESELTRVRNWPQSLKSEPEAELQALGTKLAAGIAEGDKALEERRAAAAARADHRAREIVRLIDDVNAARQAVHGRLAQRVRKHGLPRNWPDRFFRKGATTKVRAKSVPTAPAPPNP